MGNPLPNECPVYDTKMSDDAAPVIMELLGMQCTPLLPLLPGSLWFGVVALDMVLAMGQRKISCILMLNRII